jgi:hypothetical protein
MKFWVRLIHCTSETMKINLSRKLEILQVLVYSFCRFTSQCCWRNFDLYVDCDLWPFRTGGVACHQWADGCCSGLWSPHQARAQDSASGGSRGWNAGRVSAAGTRGDVPYSRNGRWVLLLDTVPGPGIELIWYFGCKAIGHIIISLSQSVDVRGNCTSS